MMSEKPILFSGPIGAIEDRAYQDSSGAKCSLEQMVRREPEWAASRIRAGEAAIAERDALQRALSSSASVSLAPFADDVARVLREAGEPLTRQEISQGLDPALWQSAPGNRQTRINSAIAHGRRKGLIRHAGGTAHTYTWEAVT